MTDSILGTIKDMLGFEEGVGIPFDNEIIQHINSAFSTLTQLGLGPKTGFAIRDTSATWDMIIPPDMNVENVKQYIFLKVKVLFDPPQSGAAMEEMKTQIKECEFRIEVEVDDTY